MIDFPCLNEEDGLECVYPMCDCEEEFYEDLLDEYPEVEHVDEAFDRFATGEAFGEWPED